MIYSYETITLVELEISTYCNAACPQCPRNYYGGKTVSNLPLINWSLNQLKQILDESFIKRLKMIYFCGTYGDPLMNNELVAMCEWLKSINSELKIGIHTNGGVGFKKTFKSLAKLVNFIAFAIDGLHDTNHIYRRNTKWNTIIENCSTFIDSGGYAVWDYIVFKHNQHQVDEAQELSKQLGFKEFNIKKTGRFFDRNHKLHKKLEVLDNNKNFAYNIEPSTIQFYKNTGYDIIESIDLQKYVKETKITCYLMNQNMLYIGADGYVFPCGFLHDRLYGADAENYTDYQKLKSLMEYSGGEAATNVFHSPLENIVNGNWFKCLKESWGNHRRIDRCAMMCGDTINVVKQQNTDIQYKNV